MLSTNKKTNLPHKSKHTFSINDTGFFLNWYQYFWVDSAFEFLFSKQRGQTTLKATQFHHKNFRDILFFILFMDKKKDYQRNENSKLLYVLALILVQPFYVWSTLQSGHIHIQWCFKCMQKCLFVSLSNLS